MKIKLGDVRRAKVTGKAEETKTRDAAETSSEVTHVPDPLHLTVDGGIAEDIQAGAVAVGIKLREPM